MMKLSQLKLRKSIPIRSFSVPHFPAFGLNTERYEVFFIFSPNAVKCRPENSKYGHFLRNATIQGQ